MERSRWRCTSSSDYESSFRYLICSDYAAVWCLLNRMWNCPQTTPSGMAVPAWAWCRVAGTRRDLCVWEEEMQAPRSCRGVGSGRARSLWPEHPALFPADPPVRPSPWTIRCAVGHASAPVSTALPSEVLPRTVGRKGVLACAVPGQAPVPWPVGWERGELRFSPRFPNPESEAFIPSILTCVTLWPSKKEK